MKSKRKIKPTRKASFWPCGSCRKNAEGTDCIFCETCNQWYHSCCENISPDDFGILRNSSVQYTCRKCFACEVGDSEYNYRYGLSRLAQALQHGKDALRLAAKREQELIPDFELYNSELIPQDFVEVDLNAKAILEKCKLTCLGNPSLTTGDGNCLFNAVSIALSGHEGYSTELRLRTAVDMAVNGEIYKSRTDYQELVSHSPTYDESLVDCCNDRSWSSIFTIISLSIVIGKPIRSVYPPMNGASDPAYRALSKTFWAQCPKDDSLSILWSRQSNIRGKWYPNHFVPLIQSKNKPPILIDTSTPVVNRKRKADYTITNNDSVTFKIYKIDSENIQNHQEITPIKFAQDIPDESPVTNSVGIGTNTCPLGPTTNSPNLSRDHETRVKKKVGIGSNTCPLGPTTNSPENNTEHENKIRVGIGSNTCPLGPTFYESDSTSSDENPHTISFNEELQELPIPDSVSKLNKLHSYQESFDLIRAAANVLPVVPPGNKSNCFMLINNTDNVKNLESKKKCQFFDDCGVWDTSKGNTRKTYLVREKSGSLREVALKGNQFCVKKRSKYAVVWEPLEPQPQDEDIFVMSRYYTALKRHQDFKKRVTFFTNTKDTSIATIALYEYEGSHPITSQPHGNAKKGSTFVRTHPEVMKKIDLKLPTQNTRQIFHELRKEDSILAPRDFNVIRNAKQKQRKTESTRQRSNIADEILEVLDMLHTHPFVQTIIHNKDKVPHIICYTEEQIIDMRHFLANKKTEPIGIDRTFNLGSFFVTTLVYKNYRLVRKDTNTNPVFLGPMMLHKDATYPTYKSFLESIATALDDDITMLQIRISDKMDFGTDDEKALTKAIDHVFPKATRQLCTKHLKDNVNFFVQSKVGMDQKSRNDIINDIFGSTGLVECNTTIDFEEKSSEMSKKLEKYPSLEHYFTNLLKPRIGKYVINPNRKNANRNWTNNACESLNNILKLTTDWKPQKSKDLIMKLYSVVDLHYHDYRAALHGVGNYILAPQEKRYCIPDALWRCKSEQEKRTAFMNFLKDKKKQLPNDYTTSKDGQYRVINKAKGIAKKPGQRKRARNERANQRY